MKKTIIVLTFILFSLFSSTQSFACSNQSITTATIDYLYYDSNDQTYYAVSNLDSLEGHWVLDIETLQASNTNTLDELNKAYKGKQILINYIGDINLDNDIEIVSSKIVPR